MAEKQSRRKKREPSATEGLPVTELATSTAHGDGEDGEKPEVIRIAQDEFNLAVFPIAVLDKRAQKSKNYLTFTEHITSNGREIQRVWTVMPHPIEGLPSTTDEDVYVALMELSYEQGAQKKVYFSRYDLIRRLGWPMNAKHYERLESSLRKLAAVRIEAKNAYVDRHSGRLVDVGMSIIQEFKIFDEGAGKRTGAKSYVMWSDRVAQSLSEKLFKKLDADFYFNLTSPIAKRLFRYLDKKFGSGDYFVINVRKLAFEHVGMSRELLYVSQIMQRLEPALNELVAKQFLIEWTLAEETIHFRKNLDFGARIQQMALPIYDVMDAMCDDDLSPEERAVRDVALHLEGQLMARGMIGSVAKKLVESFELQGKLETIEQAITTFDRQYRQRDLANPGGLLYTLIVNGQDALPKLPPKRRRPAGKMPSVRAEKPAEASEAPEVGVGAGEAGPLFPSPSQERVQDLELGYLDHLERTGEALLAQLKKTELKELVAKEREALLASDRRKVYARWEPDMLDEHLRRLVGRKLAEAAVEPFADWCIARGVKPEDIIGAKPAD
ncbi:MAG: plasmid replication initiator TrfA [Chloracidobacterium sp.]